MKVSVFLLLQAMFLIVIGLVLMWYGWQGTDAECEEEMLQVPMFAGLFVFFMGAALAALPSLVSKSADVEMAESAVFVAEPVAPAAAADVSVGSP